MLSIVKMMARLAISIVAVMKKLTRAKHKNLHATATL